MTELRSRAYVGHVVHKRLSPRPHAFTYRVFALCLDVDEIDTLASRLRLFSRGKPNLVSFHDRDYAEGSGASVAASARRTLAEAGLAAFSARIELVTYPRLLGYVFNPLSVYFCSDADGRLGAIVYEVTNTFRERKSYLVPVDPDGGAVLGQGCRKELYVSPFTSQAGTYAFHIRPPAETVVLGVALRENGNPTLKTHFRGERRPLTDASLAGLVLRHPMMTLKVIGAIHLEALRLWAKGVPLITRHTSPPYSVTVVPTPTRTPTHA